MEPVWQWWLLQPVSQTLSSLVQRQIRENLPGLRFHCNTGRCVWDEAVWECSHRTVSKGNIWAFKEGGWTGLADECQERVSNKPSPCFKAHPRSSLLSAAACVRQRSRASGAQSAWWRQTGHELAVRRTKLVLPARQLLWLQHQHQDQNSDRLQMDNGPHAGTSQTCWFWQRTDTCLMDQSFTVLTVESSLSSSLNLDSTAPSNKLSYG